MTPTKEIDVSDLLENQKLGWFRVSIILWSCAIMFIEGYDMQVVAYAAPSMIQAWAINKAYFGPVFGFGLFGYMLGATLLSHLGDRFGRKTMILGGAWLFGAFTLATAYATSLTALFVLRFIAGIGLGASIPTTIALTVEYAASRARATMISVMFIGYTLGAMLGGVIAAKLIPAFGWPVVFYIGGIAPIVLAAILIFTLPESVRFLALKQDRPDRVAAILSKLRPDVTLDPHAQFVLREEKQSGLPVRHLFTEGRASMTLLLWFAFATSLLGHYFLTSWLPTVLVGTGVPLARAVIAGALVQGGGGAGGLVVCRLLDKRGVFTIAMAFAAAAPFIALISSAGTSDALLMTLVFLTGFCLLGGQIGLNAISGTFYPTYIRATGAGWAFGVGRVGSILGPVLGGILISFNPPISLLFLCAAAPALCCAGATYLLGRAPAAARSGPAPAVSSTASSSAG